ncbi:MAG TPA: glucose-6-phosphate isomerase [Elusimicrobiota bacterium]|nr:glucose-6-phosphate isomerase [Elusimicrobiota bacterium]
MLSLNYSHCLSDSIGVDHGLMEPEILGLQTRLQEAHSAVARMASAGKLGFVDLPKESAEAKRIMAWARKKRGSFDTLVVLGIGGSALGNMAVQQALRTPYWNLLPPKERGGWLRLFVFDNVDPRWASDLMHVINPKKTLFNVISKSGTTAESLASYFYFRKAVEQAAGAKKAGQHFVFTTDAQKGYLRELATKEKVDSFSVPDNVGGRFSVLSPVGLVSAALTGVNIVELLGGALSLRERFSSGSLRENGAAMYAAIQYLYFLKGVKLSVLMPYSQNLWGVADWYRQLWAESLGKKTDRSGKTVFTGPTPIKALGVTDQHSQAQLYMEGPYDKIITFLSVQDFGRKTPIPAVDKGHYLSGHSFNELLKAEEQGTRSALAKAQRPNLTLSVSEISAHTLGELFFFFEMAVAYMGELININAFDQPGVELAKVYTYALMGRSGFETQRNELGDMEKKDAQGAHTV